MRSMPPRCAIGAGVQHISTACDLPQDYLAETRLSTGHWTIRKCRSLLIQKLFTLEERSRLECGCSVDQGRSEMRQSRGLSAMGTEFRVIDGRQGNAVDRRVNKQA